MRRSSAIFSGVIVEREEVATGGKVGETEGIGVTEGNGEIEGSGERGNMTGKEEEGECITLSQL